MTFLLAFESGYLDVISVNFWHMLISAINLYLLYRILKRFLFRPVQKVMTARSSQVEQIYSEAATAKSEAESARTEYTEKLSHAEADAEELLRAATARANGKSDEILEEARTEAQNLRRRADEEIAQERKKAINEIKDDISGISMEIAEKVVERELRGEDHRDLVDRFIGELEERPDV